MTPTDTTNIKLERNAFMAAFERVAKRLAKGPYNYARTGKKYPSLSFWRERIYGDVPSTLGDLLVDDLDDRAIAVNFISLLVMRELGMPQKTFRVKGDLRLGRPGKRLRHSYFAGNLEVSGNLGYEHEVLVLGDLTVGGLIEDRFEGSPLLVAGSVRAKGMYIGSETKIAGRLDVADVLHLRRTRGGNTLFVERGAKTKLHVWTPDDSKMTGKLKATHRVEAYPERNDRALVKVRGLLSKKLDRALDADEPELAAIVAALRDGKSIWR